MLAIRMQRTGRKGHSQFRVVVQDSRFSPSSGRVVAYLGSYNPHSKSAVIDKEKIVTYLSNGAQPSERVTRLLKSEGVAVPSWVNELESKTRTIRNQDKLRRNRPKQEVVEEPKEPTIEPEAKQAPAETVPAVEEPITEPAPAEEEVATEPDAEIVPEITDKA